MNHEIKLVDKTGYLIISPPNWPGKITLELADFDRNPNITPYLAKVISEIENLSIEDRIAIRHLLNNHCRWMCHEVDWGIEHDDENYPGNYDVQSPLLEDIERKVRGWDVVYSYHDTVSENTIFTFEFKPDWDLEHGVIIMFRNGKLLGLFDHIWSDPLEGI